MVVDVPPITNTNLTSHVMGVLKYNLSCRKYALLHANDKFFWTTIQKFTKTKPTLQVTLGVHLCESSLILLAIYWVQARSDVKVSFN
jgi:hypothetical protein